MRFVLLYKSGKPETNDPPSPKEMEAVRKLVQEMAHAGVLLGTEGFEPSEKGARILVSFVLAQLEAQGSQWEPKNAGKSVRLLTTISDSRILKLRCN